VALHALEAVLYYQSSPESSLQHSYHQTEHIKPQDRAATRFKLLFNTQLQTLSMASSAVVRSQQHQRPRKTRLQTRHTRLLWFTQSQRFKSSRDLWEELKPFHTFKFKWSRASARTAGNQSLKNMSNLASHQSHWTFSLPSWFVYPLRIPTQFEAEKLLTTPPSTICSISRTFLQSRWE